MAWTIQQVSSKTGIPADSLRYYDKLGIVSPERHENGYRYYDEQDISDLKYLTVMKYARFSLSEIKTIIGLSGNPPTPECNEIARAVLGKKAGELKQVAQNYQRIIRLLQELLPLVDSKEAYCDNQSEIDAFVTQIYEDIR